jgi:hypothetical protein
MNIIVFDRNRDVGVDIDYIEVGDGIEVLYIDELTGDDFDG